jgi:hypothetical protein
MLRNLSKNPLMALAIAALVYTAPGFLPGRVLVPLDLMADEGAWKRDPLSSVPVSNRLLSDAVLQFVPWDEAVRGDVASGRFPWQNPYAGDGRPLFANPQAALLSPFTWPRLTFGIKGWALSVFLKLLLAGLGAFWLAREMGATKNASLLSGFVYLASGFSVLWGLHPHSNTFAALPVLAAALMRLLAERTPTNTILVILSAALATSGGHVETLAVGVFGIALFLLWERSSLSRAGVSGYRGRVWALASAATGFLLLAVQIVPFLFILSRSRLVDVRRSDPPDAFRIVAVGGQLIPGFLGSPLKKELDLSGALPYGENFNTRSQGFIGGITLVLLAVGARRVPRPFRRGLIIGLVGLLVAWRVPPLGFLAGHLPVLRLIASQYWIVLFVLFGSLAAGPVVMAAKESGPSQRLGRGVLVLGLILLIAGILPAIPASRSFLLAVGRFGIQKLRAQQRLLGHPPEVYEARMQRYLSRGQQTALRRLAMPGAFWAIAGMGLLARKRRVELLAIAVVGELLSFGLGYLPAIRYSDIPDPPDAVRVVRRLDPGLQWMTAAAPEIYSPNLATIHRIRDLRSYDVLESAETIHRLRRYGYDENLRAFRMWPTAVQSRALASEGVRFFFSRSMPKEGRLVGGAQPPGVGVYELPNAAVRAFPSNQIPVGFALGASVSLVAVLLSIILVSASAFRRRPPHSLTV